MSSPHAVVYRPESRARDQRRRRGIFSVVAVGMLALAGTLALIHFSHRAGTPVRQAQAETRALPMLGTIDTAPAQHGCTPGNTRAAR